MITFNIAQWRAWAPGLVSADETEPCHWPHAVDLLRCLLTRQPDCHHAWKNRVWTWQRKH